MSADTLKCRHYASVFYNPDWKIAYLKNPKAGTNVFDTLFWEVLENTRVLGHGEKLPQDTFYFTFVEDPINHARKAYATVAMNQAKNNTNITTQGFVEDIMTGNASKLAWATGAIALQTASIFCTDAGKELDYVAYLERFGTEWEALADLMNLTDDLRERGRQLSPESEYYSNAMFATDSNPPLSSAVLRKLCGLYKTDFQCLGYVKPFECNRQEHPECKAPQNRVIQGDEQVVFEHVDPNNNTQTAAQANSGRRFLGTDICRRGLEEARLSTNPALCRTHMTVLWSERFKIAYLKVSKAAANVFEKHFYAVFEDARPLEQFDLLPEDAFVFTFVEEPVLHARKSYAAVGVKESLQVSSFIIDTADALEFPRVSRDRGCGNERFNAFLRDLGKGRFSNITHSADMATTQTSSIACTMRKHNHQLSYIGHLERVDTDWAAIQQLANIPVEIRTKATLVAQENINPEHPLFQDDLNVGLSNATIWAVCAMYVTDYSCLGYALPEPCLAAAGPM